MSKESRIETKHKKLFCRLTLSLFIWCCSQSFLYAQPIKPQTVWDTVIAGHFLKDDVRKKIIYIPINVPAGITGFNMRATITDSANNVLDIGLFDEKGIELGPVNGFRGWAGGVSSKQVHITKEGATPSYIAGSINKGVWNVMLVPTTIKKEGFDWQLNVSLERTESLLENFSVKPSREWINNKRGWYRGDLHMHDVNSDGVFTQGELVKLSKAANLQFIIPTNHNTNAANLNWGRYDDGSILILNGEEITPFQENHWNAIGINPDTWIEWRYDAASGIINKYQEQVRHAGGLCVINHPFYNNDSIVDYRFPVEGFDAIEVWNGTWDINDEYAVSWWDDLLKKGLVKTAIGASDFHRHDGKNILSHPQTVVYAQGLNRKAIIDGIRKGRCYIAENSKINLGLQIMPLHSNNSVAIGDTVSINEKDKLSVVCKVAGIPDSSMVILISILQWHQNLPRETGNQQ
jgi:predicted metal-dependent phosphoesterase TrpH